MSYFFCNPFMFINVTGACTAASRHENYDTKVSIFITVTILFTVIATGLIIHGSTSNSWTTKNLAA